MKIEITILIMFTGLVAGMVYWGATAECIESHVEKQYQMPMGMAIGNSGLSVPIGNAKEVEVTVCDTYK